MLLGPRLGAEEQTMDRREIQLQYKNSFNAVHFIPLLYLRSPDLHAIAVDVTALLKISGAPERHRLVSLQVKGLLCEDIEGRVASVVEDLLALHTNY